MSGVCLIAAAMSVALPLDAFTLAWTHSIEKIRWEEDYRVAGHELELTEARIRGSGAGMEVPEGAVLKAGVWHYRPPLANLKRLNLARSGYVPDYELCWEGSCRPMSSLIGPPAQSPLVELTSCASAPKAEAK